MKDEQITASNIAIATFMGWATSSEFDSSILFMPSGAHKHISELDYHKSWLMLMPVVEKIEALQINIWGRDLKYFRVRIENNFCSISGHDNIKQDGMYYQTPYGSNPADKITAVYDAVSDFILLLSDQQGYSKRQSERMLNSIG